MADYDADVVIVGAGVAGALMAAKLAQAGVKVLILEAGPSGDRAASLATYQQALAKTPDSPYPDTAYAPRPSVLSLKDGYYLQKGRDLFKSTYERRVGGTTWHWLGTTLRLHPNDFELKTRYGIGLDWPIQYRDLEPYYLQAESEMGVAGDSAEDLGSPRSGPYPMPPLPQSYLDKQLAKALSGSKFEVRSTPQARNSELYDERPPCCGNSSCIPICPIQAKYDATVHTKKAIAAGAQLLDKSVVSGVVVGAEGTVSEVRFKRPDGSEHRATGRRFVLAAHAIETPKLLLMSRTNALPNGVANRSDQVGRNLMDHPAQLSWALAKDPVFPYRGPLSTSGIENLRDSEARSSYAHFRIEIGNDGWSWPRGDVTVLASELIGQGLWGDDLNTVLREHAAREVRVTSLCEQLPDPENRIVPAFNTPDALGIPRPQIHYNVDAYTQRGLEQARQKHTAIFQALGARDIHHRDEYEGAGHIMGTYRMGNDPKTSVVSAEQRSHDHLNLFLVGSGVFPTVGNANPTLTIAALALQAAGTVQRDLQTGT